MIDKLKELEKILELIRNAADGSVLIGPPIIDASQRAGGIMHSLISYALEEEKDAGRKFDPVECGFVFDDLDWQSAGWKISKVRQEDGRPAYFMLYEKPHWSSSKFGELMTVEEVRYQGPWPSHRDGRRLLELLGVK